MTQKASGFSELPKALTQAIIRLNALYDIVLSMQKQAKKNTSKKDTETYLDVSQVAELTHYSQQTIRMKVMGDEIPSFKLNGRRLFRESDILNWISNGGR